MSTSQTTNLHLVKPDDSEYPDVSVINGNMDILDEKMGAVGGTDLQTQVNRTAKLHSSIESSTLKANQGGDLWQNEYYDSDGNRYVMFFDSSGFGIYDETGQRTKRINWDS